MSGSWKDVINDLRMINDGVKKADNFDISSLYWELERQIDMYIDEMEDEYKRYCDDCNQKDYEYSDLEDEYHDLETEYEDMKEEHRQLKDRYDSLLIDYLKLVDK